MILLRSFLYQILLIGSTIFFSIAVLTAGLARLERAVDRLGSGWSHVNLWALRKICGLDYRIRGMENIPAEPTVVLAKHQSAWETIAFWSFLPTNQSWVLKQELTRIPIFGWALMKFKPIPIDRSAGRREITRLIREGTDRLSTGRIVIVFPEGTRVAPGTHRAYGVGGALLAERSGRPVLPIAHNAGIFWGRRSIMKRPGIIDVVIGPLIETNGRKATEINALAEAWIEKTVAELPSSVS